MKKRLFNLILLSSILITSRVVFAYEQEQEPLSGNYGWLTYKSNQISISYPQDINLRKLEARLRSRWFTVSAAEKDLYTNPSYPIEERILARLESILLRTKQILTMDPPCLEIKIKIFRDRNELCMEYSRLFGSTEHFKSFYVHPLGTIFTSMQDVSDSEMSHEMAHAVIDNHFRVIPPEKTAELLATYVDSHLERE
ncbi:MAG: hypothetical protein WC417_00945 [Candidatus Omnitrophota bacterium]|jgi:hypothetical protein